MWPGKPIDLEDWTHFGAALHAEMQRIGHAGLVAVRNFQLTTVEVDCDMMPLGEVDRLDLVLRTGTDRDATSWFWNAEGHDHPHDLTPSGKSPQDIIYAYVAEVGPHGYLVHYQPGGAPEEMDLTTALSDQEGILIYDAAKLTRVSKNEHWFTGDPRDALLAVFKLAE